MVLKYLSSQGYSENSVCLCPVCVTVLCSNWNTKRDSGVTFFYRQVHQLIIKLWELVNYIVCFRFSTIQCGSVGAHIYSQHTHTHTHTHTGTPITRIPIMAKQPLDLYKLFKLVVERGGLVEVRQTVCRLNPTGQW